MSIDSFDQRRRVLVVSSAGIFNLARFAQNLHSAFPHASALRRATATRRQTKPAQAVGTENIITRVQQGYHSNPFAFGKTFLAKRDPRTRFLGGQLGFTARNKPWFPLPKRPLDDRGSGGLCGGALGGHCQPPSHGMAKAASFTLLTNHADFAVRGVVFWAGVEVSTSPSRSALVDQFAFPYTSHSSRFANAEGLVRRVGEQIPCGARTGRRADS